MRHVTLPDGTSVPALGFGTWRMGERTRQRKAEVRAVSAALDRGLSLIDTAEMYGEGVAEEIIAEAIAGRRDAAFLVSKVYPHNASAQRMAEACERSLKRLNTDRIDLYLLHWRGNVPLAETVEGFEGLKSEGKILRWGVSNFDVDDMAELHALERGESCQTNQILYHLGERGPEWSLMPWCKAQAMPVMAYSPLGQGSLLSERELKSMARERGLSPAALAVAWTLRRSDVISIPKTSNLEHLREIAEAEDLVLTDDELARFDRAFPPPSGPSALNIH